MRSAGVRIALFFVVMCLMLAHFALRRDNAAGDDLDQALRADSSAEAGRAVFLGSSTFRALDAAGIVADALNLAISGDTAAELSRRMKLYRSLDHARVVILNIGFNDVRTTCKAIPEQTWRSILSEIPGGTPLVVVGLQGVGSDEMKASCAGGLARLIAAENVRWLARCAHRPRCRFVANPVDPFVSAADSARLQQADGVHLSPEGYRRLSESLRAALASES